MDDYRFGPLIGQGQNRVYSATYLPTGTRVAIKLVPKLHYVSDVSSTTKPQKPEERNRERDEARSAHDMLKSEVACHKSLRHRNILRLLACLGNERECWFIMELAGKDFLTILRGATNPEGRLSEGYIRDVVAPGLVSGLDYLHNVKGIVHRDLKLQNILMGLDGHVKICDFGFARYMNNGETDVASTDFTLTSVKGTPIYMAPELIQEQPYNHAVDLWALGVMLFELFTGLPPFYTTNIFTLVNMILDDDIKWPSLSMSRQFFELLSGLLQKDPNRRLGWPILASHPFITSSKEVLSSEVIEDEGVAEAQELSPVNERPGLKKSVHQQKRENVVHKLPTMPLSTVKDPVSLPSHSNVHRDSSFLSETDPGTGSKGSNAIKSVYIDKWSELSDAERSKHSNTNELKNVSEKRFTSEPPATTSPLKAEAPNPEEPKKSIFGFWKRRRRGRKQTEAEKESQTPMDETTALKYSISGRPPGTAENTTTTADLSPEPNMERVKQSTVVGPSIGAAMSKPIGASDFALTRVDGQVDWDKVDRFIRMDGSLDAVSGQQEVQDGARFIAESPDILTFIAEGLVYTHPRVVIKDRRGETHLLGLLDISNRLLHSLVVPISVHGGGHTTGLKNTRGGGVEGSPNPKHYLIQQEYVQLYLKRLVAWLVTMLKAFALSDELLGQTEAASKTNKSSTDIDVYMLVARLLEVIRTLITCLLMPENQQQESSSRTSSNRPDFPGKLSPEAPPDPTAPLVSLIVQLLLPILPRLLTAWQPSPSEFDDDLERERNGEVDDDTSLNEESVFSILIDLTKVVFELVSHRGPLSVRTNYVRDIIELQLIYAVADCMHHLGCLIQMSVVTDAEENRVVYQDEEVDWRRKHTYQHKRVHGEIRKPMRHVPAARTMAARGRVYRNLFGKCGEALQVLLLLSESRPVRAETFFESVMFSHPSKGSEEQHLEKWNLFTHIVASVSKELLCIKQTENYENRFLELQQRAYTHNRKAPPTFPSTALECLCLYGLSEVRPSHDCPAFDVLFRLCGCRGDATLGLPIGGAPAGPITGTPMGVDSTAFVAHAIFHSQQTLQTLWETAADDTRTVMDRTKSVFVCVFVLAQSGVKGEKIRSGGNHHGRGNYYEWVTERMTALARSLWPPLLSSTTSGDNAFEPSAHNGSTATGLAGSLAAIENNKNRSTGSSTREELPLFVATLHLLAVLPVSACKDVFMQPESLRVLQTLVRGVLGRHAPTVGELKFMESFCGVVDRLMVAFKSEQSSELLDSIIKEFFSGCLGDDAGPDQIDPKLSVRHSGKQSSPHSNHPPTNSRQAPSPRLTMSTLLASSSPILILRLTRIVYNFLGVTAIPTPATKPTTAQNPPLHHPSHQPRESENEVLDVKFRSTLGKWLVKLLNTHSWRDTFTIFEAQGDAAMNCICGDWWWLGFAGSIGDASLTWRGGTSRGNTGVASDGRTPNAPNAHDMVEIMITHVVGALAYLNQGGAWWEGGGFDGGRKEEDGDRADTVTEKTKTSSRKARIVVARGAEQGMDAVEESDGLDGLDSPLRKRADSGYGEGRTGRARRGGSSSQDSDQVASGSKVSLHRHKRLLTIYSGRVKEENEDNQPKYPFTNPAEIVKSQLMSNLVAASKHLSNERLALPMAVITALLFDEKSASATTRSWVEILVADGLGMNVTLASTPSPTENLHGGSRRTESIERLRGRARETHRSLGVHKKMWKRLLMIGLGKERAEDVLGFGGQISCKPSSSSASSSLGGKVSGAGSDRTGSVNSEKQASNDDRQQRGAQQEAETKRQRQPSSRWRTRLLEDVLSVFCKLVSEAIMMMDDTTSRGASHSNTSAETHQKHLTAKSSSPSPSSSPPAFAEDLHRYIESCCLPPLTTVLPDILAHEDARVRSWASFLATNVGGRMRNGRVKGELGGSVGKLYGAFCARVHVCRGQIDSTNSKGTE
ncbi:Serine/threonine-protein kinase 36 [Quaeritorhiza haematococci]|nr:Serine/threonine-protein kinase 36 [Quaeritorhiza haematococci]